VSKLSSEFLPLNSHSDDSLNLSQLFLHIKPSDPRKNSISKVVLDDKCSSCFDRDSLVYFKALEIGLNFDSSGITFANSVSHKEATN